jgi:hypothetical protein
MNHMQMGWIAAAVACIAACSAPANQGVDQRETAALAPLKSQYPDTVMGFDIRPETTLIVSLDLQHYIDMEDDEIAAMKRNALARWRGVWLSAHPHEHAVLVVRFIDFIGRRVAAESTKV